MRYIVYDEDTKRVAAALDLPGGVVLEWPNLVTRSVGSMDETTWQDLSKNPTQYIVQLDPFRVVRDNPSQNSLL